MGIDDHLSARDLLQVNATIIAGALVLLTINAATDITGGAFNRYAITTMTVATLMPFAFSAFALFDNKRIEVARQFTRWGFVVLIVALAGLGVLIAFDQYNNLNKP